MSYGESGAGPSLHCAVIHESDQSPPAFVVNEGFASVILVALGHYQLRANSATGFLSPYQQSVTVTLSGLPVAGSLKSSSFSWEQINGEWYLNVYTSEYNDVVPVIRGVRSSFCVQIALSPNQTTTQPSLVH